MIKKKKEVYLPKKKEKTEKIETEKLKIGEKEAENMISLVMLLKPAIYLFSPNGAVPKNTANGQVFPNNFTKSTGER